MTDIHVCRVQALRQVAVEFRIDLSGLIEKQELAQALREEFKSKMNINEQEADNRLLRECLRVQEGVPPPPSTVGLPIGEGCVRPVPAEWRSHESIEDRMTVDVEKSFQLFESMQRESGQPFADVWRTLPDGSGMWCFKRPGGNGLPLFYKFMADRNLTLAFRSERWRLPEVVLEPYMVLCWCLAGYIWPYCMLCHKFCFPYSDDATSHRYTRRHGARVSDWHVMGNREAFRLALRKEPRFGFFAMNSS